MNNDNAFVIALGVAVLFLAGVAVLLGQKKKEATEQIGDRKKELLEEHFKKDGKGQEGVGEGIEGAATCSNPPGEAIDPSVKTQNPFVEGANPSLPDQDIDLQELANSLCDYDESCRNLVDFVNHIGLAQHINGALLVGVAAWGTFSILGKKPSQGGDTGKNLNLTKPRSNIRIGLEREALSRIKDPSVSSQHAFEKCLEQIRAENSIPEHRWQQILMAALNLEDFSISFFSNPPTFTHAFLDRASLTEVEKRIAKLIVEKGGLTLDKKFNPLFDAFKGKAHTSR